MRSETDYRETARMKKQYYAQRLASGIAVIRYESFGT